MTTNTRMAALFAVVALLLCVRTSSGQGNSYSVSSFHHESFGPDGIVMGRSGYKDSSGKSRFTHYQVGKDGRKKFIRDDPEGDIESRSLLPDPSKVGFGFPGGFPGFGDPHLDFFKALGFPKSAFFPGFPQELLPRDLLPPFCSQRIWRLRSRSGGSQGQHEQQLPNHINDRLLRWVSAAAPHHHATLLPTRPASAGTADDTFSRSQRGQGHSSSPTACCVTGSLADPTATKQAHPTTTSA
ncbi:hypothetical protein MTO96_051241 [Rhipicephalus appendiculatus]